MLHMVVNTHDPDACAFRGPEHRDRLTASLRSLEQHAAEHGATVEGAWMSMTGHTLFAVVDAPNAHAVELVVRDAGLVGWTTTRVWAVDTMDNTLDAIARQ